MTRLIVACCFLNEERFIRNMIRSLKHITDIDYVHFFDGAWWHPDITHQTNSTDETVRIIADTMPELNISYNIAQMSRLFKNESDKRNTQLSMIHQKMHEDYWILVLDGDEQIEANGNFELKPYLEIFNIMDAILVDCEGNQTDCIKATLRLIKGGQNLHYHTGRPMVVHDKNCKIVNDYSEQADIQNTYKTHVFRIVNNWLLKNTDRMLQKYGLWKHTQANKTDQCDWLNSSFSST